MKSRDGKSQRREEKKKGDQKGKSLRRKKIQVREKVGKSRNTVFFQWFAAPEGRKVRSLKRRVRSQLARWEVKNSTPLWREAHFKVKSVKKLTGPEHFWKLRCRKIACHCGAKHISKSKCTKHLRSGTLFEIEMSKKCTPLWREAHFEVKMSKTPHVRTALGSWDVEKVHAVVARSTFRSKKCKKLRGSEHFWTFRCRFAWQAQGIVHPVYIPLHYTTLHYTPLHFTTPHYTTLNCTTLHYTTLHYTTATLHYITFHYTTLHYTTLHYTTFNYTTLHSTTLQWMTLHYTYNYNYNCNCSCYWNYTTLQHYISLITLH